MVQIVAGLALEEGIRRDCINVANFSDYSMSDIVTIMEKVVGKKALFDSLDKGDTYPIDTQRIYKIARRCGVGFGPYYLESVIRKYYESRAHEEIFLF